MPIERNGDLKKHLLSFKPTTNRVKLGCRRIKMEANPLLIRF